MPAKNLTIYFSDEDYVYYVKNKETLNTMARDTIKDAIFRMREKDGDL